MDHPKPISFLYTNIGRGHPFYLDGIVEQLAGAKRQAFDIGIFDTGDIATGWSRLSWRAVRRMYRWGASRGPVGRFYDRQRQRNNYNRSTAMLRLLGRDLRREFEGSTGPLVVAHPSLVGILRGRPDLVYQHGEVVTPSEALVQGAGLVCVPTEETGRPFLESGYQASQLLVTGLCIEPELVNQAAELYRDRLQRLTSDEPLTGMFVSSGAEPPQHVSTLISCIASCVRTRGRVIVLARNGGRLECRLRYTCHRERIELAEIRAGDGPIDSEADLVLALHSDRRQENDLTAGLFGAVDYLVAPPHERTNWSLGLGLPMFALTPTVGSFAPLNLKLLVESGTAIALGDEVGTGTFAGALTGHHRSGRLAEMSRRGWGKYRIDGFARIAECLDARYGGRKLDKSDL